MITICQLLDKDTGNLPALMRAISNSEEVKKCPKIHDTGAPDVKLPVDALGKSDAASGVLLFLEG